MFFLKKQVGVLIFLFFVFSISFLGFSSTALAVEYCCVSSTVSPCMSSALALTVDCIDAGGTMQPAACSRISSCPQYKATSNDFKATPSSESTVAPSLAVERTPATNPLCWKKEACEGALANAQMKWDPKKNFLVGGPNGVCGTDLGACIPAGQTDVEITIGGKVKFNELGDYVKTIYIWLLGVGGIVAVVIIIFGGFLYMTSGGSPDRVKEAKGRISSALMGLFLLIGSYTLLYTINPDLVRLRLPKAYMLRPIILGANFCDQQYEKVAFAGSGTAALTPFANITNYSIDPLVVKNKISSDSAFGDPETLDAFLTGAPVSVTSRELRDLSPKIPVCGYYYYLKDGNAQTCRGTFCPPLNKDGKFFSQTCVEGETVNNQVTFSCIQGKLSGIFVGSGNDFEKSNPLINIKLGEVCANGEVKELSHIMEGHPKADYKSSFFGGEFLKNTKQCADSLGFFLEVRIKDSDMGGGSDLFAIGCLGGNSNCSANLVKIINPALTGAEPLKFDNFVKLLKGNPTNAAKIKSFLISSGTIEAGQFIDIQANRANFPND